MAFDSNIVGSHNKTMNSSNFVIAKALSIVVDIQLIIQTWAMFELQFNKFP